MASQISSEQVVVTAQGPGCFLVVVYWWLMFNDGLWLMVDLWLISDGERFIGGFMVVSHGQWLIFQTFFAQKRLIHSGL